jgi:hypothetical protein
MDYLQARLDTLEQRTRAVAWQLRWWRGFAGGLLVLVVLTWVLPGGTAPQAPSEGSENGLAHRLAAPWTSTQVAGAFTRPLSFEPNRGQASDEARFVGRGRGYTLILGDGGRASLAVHNPQSGRPLPLAVAPAGANPLARGEPLGLLPGVTSYFRGRTLVIDPVLAYSTHLGGTGFDLGTDVAVDAAGNAYLTGRT